MPFLKNRVRKRPAKSTAVEPVVPTTGVSHPQYTIGQLWTNGLGRSSTRSIQILTVMALAAVVVWGLLQLSLVVLPLLIALILSSALWPLVRLLRRFMSAMLAAWTVFLGSLVILGGIGYLLVISVMAEAGTLASKAREGFHELQGMIQRLPINITEQQINDAIAQVTSFLTSSKHVLYKFFLK